MSYKEKGLESMLEGNYPSAINYYTLAIKNDSYNSKLFSSRAKAYYLNLKNVENPSQIQWKKIIDDCTTALELDKDNYDASFYNALTQAFCYKRKEKGLKLLNETYIKSLSKAKSYKSYSLPQEIYQEILKLKTIQYNNNNNINNDTKTQSRGFNETNKFFNKIVYLLQVDYEKKLKEILSKDVDKSVLDHAITEHAIQYNTEIKELIEMFEMYHSKDHSSTQSEGSLIEEEEEDLNDEEPPDYLCDPISFNIFHDPVITPSGQSFERSWLFQHLSNNEYDPLTRQKLTKDDCYLNLGLKACADQYLISNSKQNYK
ncbi:hypothetical protein KGF54_005178 [Candida jiufengensis]|uniref:uncharacterized protein n=1 Tax=Candida jiufengensis TaxID=497108 RepID=UPI0022250B87|nr:uncharacterized protein KGF54_005178 [Candida jiufengensis]KAI5950361.1 hypothetical protein KGF54_005178 [Candida jiufengensis]